MVLLLSDSDVRKVVTYSRMAEGIKVIEEVYKEKSLGNMTLHKRVHFEFPSGGYYRNKAIRILPGIAPKWGGGMRIYSLYHTSDIKEEGPRKLDFTWGPQLHVQYDYENPMKLLCIMNDHTKHNFRTAAPTGVATKYLSREDSEVLGVYGAGRHASWQIAAVCSVRNIKRVKVYSPTKAHREKLCKILQNEVSATLTPVDNPRDPVADSDIIITITSANKPVFDGNLLEPGMHVNVIGRGEVDSTTIRRADRIFASWKEQVLYDTPAFEPLGTMLQREEMKPESIKDLDEAVTATSPGRTNPEEITLFLSQGVGVWDIAIGRWIYVEAKKLGLGTEVDLETETDYRSQLHDLNSS